MRPTDGDRSTGGGTLIDALAQTAFMTMGVLTRLAAANELSLTQLRVLAILRDRELKISDLADYLGLERSTLTGLVSRAEKRGLLRRRPSTEDRRGVMVRLSRQGDQVAEQLAGDLAELLGPFLEVLTRADRSDLSRLLARVAATTTPAGGAPTRTRPVDPKTDTAR